jgi:hypothetical protein
MTPAQLAAAGTALYGAQWQSDLARALGVSSRDIRYWVSGQRTAPEGTRERVKSLLNKSAEKQIAIARAL